LAYGWTFGLPYIITRSTNNYGPRQHGEKLIPSAVTRLLAGRKVVVHGGGRPRRNWIHVRDHVEAIYRIVDRGDVGQAYHIASSEEFSVREVVAKVCAHLGADYDAAVVPGDRPGVDARYALDCTKLKALGWAQEHHLDESLPEIIAYYRERILRPEPVLVG
jgi:dTDP-glucose 4,6-dehydratase